MTLPPAFLPVRAGQSGFLSGGFAATGQFFCAERILEVESMLGWWILVSLQTPDERKASIAGGKPFVMAQWETGLSGRDWIQRIVESGEITPVHTGGYPDQYTAKAQHILPLIAHGPAPYSLSPDIVGKLRRIAEVIIVPELIESCSPEQMLTIETWDLS